MSFLRRSATTPTPTTSGPAPTGTGPAISLDKVPPGLISLVKSAAVSLEKNHLTNQRAAVYLVLDHSGSMSHFYGDGSVQHLAEQALGLSANLDDDGTVPVVYFGSHANDPIEADLANYQGLIDTTHPRVSWGSTNYAAAMRAVIADYLAGPGTVPAFVIFQTDGTPDSRAEAEALLREASKLPIFWAFVGFGDNIAFLEKLDDLRGRAVDNASFFHARNPKAVTNSELYDGLTTEFAGWLAAARAKGIVR